MSECGEVWACIGQQAVVVETQANGRVTLVGRTGRRLVLTDRTLKHLWVCQRRPELTDIQFCQLCEEFGFVSDRHGNRFCASHIPRNQPLLLPGDDPMAAPSFMREVFVRCPVCKQKQETDPIQRFVGNFVLFECSLCHAGWTVILGQGLPDDGGTMVDDAISAVTVLERQGFGPFEGLIGNSAYAAIRRHTHLLTGDRSMVISGVFFQIDDQCGSLTLTIFGPFKGAPYLAGDPIKVGDEFENPQTGTFLRVVMVGHQKAVLQDEDGKNVEVWLSDFWTTCRRVVRRTSYEILMSDDDLV